ncbi:MAG: hypothetical protein ABJB12_18065 [Pseudomonadota bacterium]
MTRKLVPVLWSVAALALIACSGGRPAGLERAAQQPAARVSTPEPRPALPVLPDVPFGELPPAADPRVESFFAEARRLSTPEQMMWGQTQVPPEHWHGLRAPLKRPFPGVPFTQVRAFTFGNDRAPYFNYGQSLLDRKVPGCGGSAVAKNGTLCPSLNPPGVVLSNDQSQRLINILEDGQPRPGRAPVVTMCLAQRSVQFVFYDGARPVAGMWMDTHCPYLGVHPAAAKLYPEQYMAHDHGALKALRCELALPGRTCKEPDPSLEAAFAAQTKLDGWDVSHIRLRRIPIGVPLDLKLSELNAAQKERLCIGQAMENPIQPGTGFECASGGTVYSIDTDTCIARFPACEVSVGELVACQRHSELDLCLEAPEAAHCRALLPCFFNRSATPGPPHNY